MDARLQRTSLRVGALLAAFLVGTGIIIAFPELDPRLSGPILALTITAALGLDQWLKNSGDNAPPTVAAVNVALDNAIPVLPPKVANPEVAILTDPKPPGTT